MPLLAAALSLAMGVSGVRAVLVVGGAAGGRALLRGVVAPLAAAAGIVWAVRKNGRKLVNRPVLLPEAAAPW